MTAVRPPGPPERPGRSESADPADAATPPAWFREAQQATLRREQAEREAGAKAAAVRQHARREGASSAAPARARSDERLVPGQEGGPVRGNPAPWVGASPGAMFPAAEDATMLIQRITDEAVREGVREGATVMYPTGADPAPVDLGTGKPAEPAQPHAAVVGMKTATTAGVVRAGALMAVATIVSRVTGLLAKIAILVVLTAALTSSAYTVANTLPNIVFELLIGGVLTSVAIPLLTRAQRSDADGGQEYTQKLLTIAVVGLLVATVAAVFCAPFLARLYLSGDQIGDHRLTTLTTQLGRLLLPQIFFYGLAALFGAILNTKERFAANAWAPVLNNVVVIGVAVVLYVETNGRPTLANGLPPRELLILGIGTTLGIVLQALVMVPALLRSGFRFRFRWGWDPRLTQAGGLVGWAIVYVLISQVGVVITTRIAAGAFADLSGPTIFGYASLLFQMPYGILGVAVLTAIMPRLSRHAAAGQIQDVKEDVSLANRLSAVALLPVSAALIVLGPSLAVLLFQWGHVSHAGALQIGLSIGGMAIGLVPLAVTLVQMRVFYAMQDGRTPTIINGIMVAVRVPLLLASMTLAPHWVIPGLALSTALSYLVGAAVGELWLHARFGRMGTSRTLATVVKMLVASALGGAAAYAAVNYTIGVTPAHLPDAVKALLLGGVVGLLVIAVLAAALRVEELVPVRNQVLRLLGRRPAIASATTPAEVGRSTGPDPSSRNREQVIERVTQASAGVPRDDTGTVAAGAGPVPAGSDVSSPHSETSSGQVTVGSMDTTVRGASSPDRDRTVNLGAAPSAGGPPVVLAPGATVGGRYRLVSLVATDDAGNRFWRAKDTVLPRDMAVTLLPDTNATSATVARTLRVGRLHHIGLPQTLDVGTEQGQSYVVGQWVDGATLTDLVAGGPLEPDVATSITAKVAEAVAEAHRNGIALGAINPSLVRVNFDGQVRLSHVIAHGSATTDQDIRAVGGLLYLMLTGTWPLAAGAAAATGAADEPAGSRSSGQPPAASINDGTVRLGAASSARLIQAPTRRGREVPANEVRAGVPTALSALAERALHPEDADGIHAVGAISSLLRQPEVAPVPGPEAVEEPVRPSLNPAEQRLVRERRAKLGLATVMIAAFSALIIIVVASLSKQVLANVAGPTLTGVQTLTVAPPTTAKASTGPTRTTAAKTSPSKVSGVTSGSTTVPTATTPAVPAPTVQKIVGATVYDPKGDGVKDNPDQAPQAFDGSPATSWATFVYNQQFPSLVKPGVGLTLEFGAPMTPASVTVSSESAGTSVEVRSATEPDLPYEQTTAIAQGTIVTGAPGAPGSVTIPLTNAPKSTFLVVFVVRMAPDGTRFKSVLNEISVSGS